jgi:hypothetical protein
MKFLAVLSIAPQDGSGGCWPRPRNDRLASAMIAAAMVSVVRAVAAEEFVEAARAMGNPPWRIARVHILPNIVPAVLSIAPQDGSGGCWPRPRNDRLASAMIAAAMVPVVPRPRPAAARAVLGGDAQHRQELHGPSPLDGPGRGSPARCWAGCGRGRSARAGCPWRGPPPRTPPPLLAIPFLILAIALAAFLGPSLVNAMIAIGLSATAMVSVAWTRIAGTMLGRMWTRAIRQGGLPMARAASNPVPDPGDRAGCVPRPEPRQRDDRHRPLGDLDPHPADPSIQPPA